MNPSQIINIGTVILTSLSGALAAHGYMTSSEAQAIVGGIIALLTLILSHTAHGAVNDTPPGGLRVTNSLVIVGALALMFTSTGCVSAITATGQGKVVTSVTETTLGLHVAEQTQSQTPEFDFGYNRMTVVLEPANTNGPIYVPAYANTFNFTQGTLLEFGLGESVASGVYQTLQPGDTTNTVTSQPIVPK